MQRQAATNSNTEQTQTDVDFAALADNLIATLDEVDRILCLEQNSVSTTSAATSAAAAAAAATISANNADISLTPPDSPMPSSSSSSSSLALNNCSINLFCLLPYLPSLASAAKDAAGDALSLFQAGNKSIPLLVSASTIAFLAAFELSGQSTKENLKELTEIIRQRRKPDDWPAISKGKIIAVTSIAALMATWCAFSESAQAYDFVGKIGTDYKITSSPSSRGMKITWAAVTIGATAGSGATKVLTDNYETLKVMWRLSSREWTPYANWASSLLTPTVGGFFAGLKAFHDSVQSYSVIKEIFPIHSIQAKFLLSAACTTDMISNFCFSGLTVTGQMDELFRYVQKPKFEPAKITALSISLGLAIFLSYVKRTLNMSFYQDLATQDFGLKNGTIPDSAFETLSWFILVSEVMLVMASLNPQMILWVGYLFDKVGSLLNWITQPCRTPTAFGEYPAAQLIVNGDTDPLLAAEAGIASAEGRVSDAGLFAQPPVAPANNTDLEFSIPSPH